MVVADYLSHQWWGHTPLGIWQQGCGQALAVVGKGRLNRKYKFVSLFPRISKSMSVILLLLVVVLFIEFLKVH